MILVEAKVLDATHLELSKPLGTDRGQTVLVSVVDPAEESMERQPWLAASGAALQEAYGGAEPSYPASMVKERNPDFRE